MQARHGPGRPVIIFFDFPDSSGAQLREPKLALTKPTKIEACIQFANQKGAARQKALQNLIQNPRLRKPQ